MIDIKSDPTSSQPPLLITESHPSQLGFMKFLIPRSYSRSFPTEMGIEPSALWHPGNPGNPGSPGNRYSK